MTMKKPDPKRLNVITTGGGLFNLAKLKVRKAYYHPTHGDILYAGIGLHFTAMNPLGRDYNVCLTKAAALSLRNVDGALIEGFIGAETKKFDRSVLKEGKAYNVFMLWADRKDPIETFAILTRLEDTRLELTFYNNECTGNHMTVGFSIEWVAQNKVKFWEVK